MWFAALVLAATLTGQPAAASAEDAAVPAFERGVKRVDVVATAYTSGPESTGKRPGHPQFGRTFTGTHAEEGRTIAVDPKQIPLGSLVYIEQLDQYRIAEDTGGAIQGNRIDLYMERLSDALDWGVRRVRVQVFPRI